MKFTIISYYKLESLYKGYEKELKYIIDHPQTELFSKFYQGDAVLKMSDIVDNAELSANFCYMIRELGMDKAWGPEVFRAFSYDAEKMPRDEDGLRIIAISPSPKLDAIISSEHRHIAEQMIMQGIPDARIVEYFKKELGESITSDDMMTYRDVFYNVKSDSIENNLGKLEKEKQSIKGILRDAERRVGRFVGMPIGEQKAYITQLRTRLFELEENIKTLNAAVTEINCSRTKFDMNNIEDMFTDIIASSYKRFKELDTLHDRDIPALQSQVVKVMTMAYDKAMDAKERNLGASKDVSAQIGEIYKQRLDEIQAKDLERVNGELTAEGIENFTYDMTYEEIGGVEELGVNYSLDKEEEDEI
jgi:hypothetical protein